MQVVNFDGPITVADIQALKLAAREWAVGNSILEANNISLDPNSLLGQFFDTGQPAQDSGNAVGEATVKVKGA